MRSNLFGVEPQVERVDGVLRASAEEPTTRSTEAEFRTPGCFLGCPISRPNNPPTCCDDGAGRASRSVGDPRILGLSSEAHGEQEAAVNQRYEKSCQYVGIDLHHRRSVVLRMDGEGEVLECVRIENSLCALLAEVAKAGPGAPVGVEGTEGWH